MQDGKPWKLTLAVVFACLGVELQAQTLLNPDNIPDYFGDAGVGTCQLRKEAGQTLDTDGNPVGGLKFYFEQSPLGIYLQKKSKVSFVLAAIDPDTLTGDTLYRIDMSLGKARSVEPQAVGSATGDVTNYYRDDLSAEHVPAYKKAVYRSPWDSVNVYFYGSSGGPRMSFVVLPGGAPSNISLKFEGQDSIQVDWQGALKLYVDHKWIKLEYAMAYQMNAMGGLVALPWVGTYEHIDGTSYVEFQFGTYDHAKPLIFQIGYPPIAGGAGGGSDNLTWSTSAGRDIGYTASDFILGGDHLPDNDLIVTGATADANFPANPGTTPTTVVFDVFTSRYDYAPGDDEHDAELLWTTFIIGGPAPGGTGTATGYDAPVCIKYSNAHDLIYVGGWTNSTEWPMIPDANPNDGSYYQSVRKGARDGFLCRLDPLLGDLVRSTLYGGNGDDIITTIVEDDYGRVHCYGVTDSPTGSYNSCNSPTSGLPLCNPNTQNHQQDNNAGGLDMFVARFDDDFNLTWGSFIGGTGDDRVFDSDYLPGASAAVDRVALVGSTTGSLAYPVQGTFQLTTANNGETGFIWLLNSNGRTGWGTHVHGTTNLQAVSFAAEHVRVMGLTKIAGTVPVIQACNDVSGSLSICGGDTNLEYWEHYIGEFGLETYDMKWSTLQGGPIDASAYEAADRYHAITLLHEMYRFMDMRTNADGDFMVMGMVAHLGEGGYYPTLGMWGMYDKPYDENMGLEQTEVFMSLYRYNHQRVWTTMFGSDFAHDVDPNIPGGYDWYWLNRGCDYGHDIAWVDGEVLYLVGTTGGYQFDRECPYPSPGPSYCELTAEPLADGVDSFDGMIARFDLQDINIGLTEQAFAAGSLIVFPNPADDRLTLFAPPGLSANTPVQILDATGRLVADLRYERGNPIEVAQLAQGVYSIVLRNRQTGKTLTGRFIHR